MDIFKVALIAVVACVFTVLLSQHRPEYSLIVKLASVACIIVIVSASFAEIADDITDLAAGIQLNNEYILLMIKAVIIAVTCHIVSDICTDTGNKAIASCVDLAGRTAILLLSVPMLKTLAKIARELVK